METLSPVSEIRPDYLPALYPTDDFPRYGSPRPAAAPPVIWTTETTHRDGQQGGLPLTAELGIAIYDLLCRFTGRSGAIRQAEFFVYRPADRDALQAALDRFKSGAPIEPTAWIRATVKDVELVKHLGIKEVGMLASASDYHVFHKFSPGGRTQAKAIYLDAVRVVLDAGLRPRLHLEDATRAAPEFLEELVTEVRALAAPFGPAQRPKFRLCDTLGLGLPFEEVPAPRGIPALVRLVRASGAAPEDLEFHPHNDTGLVVANCLAALRAGCAAINGTCLGKGERTGNAPLEMVLLQAIGMGYFPSARPDFTVLNELAELYAKLGQPLSPQYPLYGRDAHRTRAGIHADGLNKFWPMYAPFDVPRLIGRPLEVSLTKESGLAGIIFLARQKAGLILDKSDRRLKAASDHLQNEFAGGRQTAVEWEEIEPFFSTKPAI